MNGEIRETHKLRDAAALLSAVLSSTPSSATDYFSQQNELLSCSFSCLDIAKAFGFNCFFNNKPTVSKPRKQNSSNILVDVLSEISFINPADLNKPELKPKLIEEVFGPSKERIAQAKAHLGTGELVLSNLVSYIDNEKLPSEYSNDPLFGKVFNELWRRSDIGPPKDVFENKSNSEKLEISALAREVLQSVKSEASVFQNHGRVVDWVNFILASAQPDHRKLVKALLKAEFDYTFSRAEDTVRDALYEQKLLRGFMERRGVKDVVPIGDVNRFERLTSHNDHLFKSGTILVDAIKKNEKGVFDFLTRRQRDEAIEFANLKQLELDKLAIKYKLLWPGHIISFMDSLKRYVQE